MNKLRKAKIKATGSEVMVYRHSSRGTYIWFEDSKTEFKESELEFLS